METPEGSYNPNFSMNPQIQQKTSGLICLPATFQENRGLQENEQEQEYCASVALLLVECAE